MRTQFLAALLGCVVVTLLPLSLQAQETEGMVETSSGERPWSAGGDADAGGDFFKFIHKLSGPSFKGDSWGVSCTVPCHLDFFSETARVLGNEPSWRLGFAIGSFDRDDLGDTSGDTSAVAMRTYHLYGDWSPLALPFKPSHPLTGRISIGGGAVLHEFSGPDFEDFTHFSFPAQVQVTVALWEFFTLRAGLGAHVFLPFEDSDFAGSTVRGIKRDEPEVTGYHFMSFGIRPNATIRRIRLALR